MIKNMDMESFIGLTGDLTEGIGQTVNNMDVVFTEVVTVKNGKENGSTVKNTDGSMNEQNYS